MGRIKIEDLPKHKKISQEEMRKVLGGYIAPTLMRGGSLDGTTTTEAYKATISGSIFLPISIAPTYMRVGSPDGTTTTEAT